MRGAEDSEMIGKLNTFTAGSTMMGRHDGMGDGGWGKGESDG